MTPTPPETIPAVPPPWKLKGTIYSFMMYASRKDVDILSQKKTFLYASLEAGSSFSDGTFLGGLAVVQIIRYTESPVGPYDELVMAPGQFQYEPETDIENGRKGIEKKSNLRITKIFVSQTQTCWNGRANWNIPKHLARFSFTTLHDNAIAIAVYSDVSDHSGVEINSNPTPVFSAVYKPISFLPRFPVSTGVAKYIGMDLSIVQPPLPEGNGASSELPGTDRWCQLLPLEYSQKGSLGWWDLNQGGATETDALLGGADADEDQGNEGGKNHFDNWWPGIGRWRIGLMMEDATIDFPEGKYWTV